MNNGKGVVELIEEGQYEVEHGDYKRIAQLTEKPNGGKFTSDYVGKVLKGLRKNALIEKKASLYFKKKAKLKQSLMES